MKTFATLTLIALVGLMPVALQSHGDHVHGDQWALNKMDNLFAVGAVEDKFEYFPAEDVEGLIWQLNWTLAACVQMIGEHQDLHASQQAIMKQIFKKKEDQALSYSQIRKALNGYHPVNNRNEERRHFHAKKTSVKGDTIADKIRKHGPIVVWLEDTSNDVNREPHPVVLLQVWFEYDYFNQEVPKKVVLFDPYPHPQEKRKEMTWYDFSNLVYDAMQLDVHER